jgi:acetylornithine deacetylase/succinyl-diaminopimelate desuccinylase-like protein
MTLKEVLEKVDTGVESSLELLKAYCRLPTVSAEKRAQSETASLVRGFLSDLGFDAREISTDGGPPVVFGQLSVDEKLPTLLMYQHYDVQPVDPLDEWRHDPFDPVIENDRFLARGCGDTKGNLIAQLLAVKAWQQSSGSPPINLKFVVEGEEEVGSPHFPKFVEGHRDLLRADGATIEGGDHMADGRPRIELGCKGILYVDLVCRTAKVDQHSSYAAISPNAAWRLIECLDRLRSQNGKILIPGWYEGARVPTPEELRFLRKTSLRVEDLKEYWGVRTLRGGSDPYRVVRTLLYSPTCTICGFQSGFTAEGTKTVNPAVARAKLDFRLVPGMRIESQLERLQGYLRSEGFDDIELVPHKEQLQPSAISLQERVVRAAIEGARDVSGADPEVWPWSPGASANGFFNDVMGVPSILGPGVSYDGSNFHAPNENIRLTDFRLGARHMAAMMGRFSPNGSG